MANADKIIREDGGYFHNEQNNRAVERSFIDVEGAIATKEINDYIHENDNDAALAIDPHHGMTPLHMLTMNPHAPADAIAALFNSNMYAIFCAAKDSLRICKILQCWGLVGMITSFCNYRNSSILVKSDTDQENTSKRRRL